MKNNFSTLFKISFAFLLLLSTSLQAQVVSKPNRDRLVNNFSKEFPDFLSEGEQQVLEDKLDKFSRETSNQIAIVIVDDLNGMDAGEYAVELGEEWGIGKDNNDNGIVILIKPTGGSGERKFFIAVGQGLEGMIPDAVTYDIQERELLPAFKDGNYYEGLDKTTTVLMQLAKKEYSSSDYQDEGRDWGWIIFVVIFMVIIVVAAMFGKGGSNNGGGNGFTYGAAGFFMGSSMGRSSGGFGGGGSSGGFGGFGGGSFGGGGSGGSW